MQFTYPFAVIKDVQATREALVLKRKKSSTVIFVGYLTWIRIRIPNLDPDPLT